MDVAYVATSRYVQSQCSGFLVPALFTGGSGNAHVNVANSAPCEEQGHSIDLTERYMLASHYFSQL
jgi:hypothetical protein